MTDIKFTPQVPYKMRNGAELVGICFNFEQNYGIALCKWRKSERHVNATTNPEGWEYVTWQVAVSDREAAWDGRTFIPLLVAEVGHYFTSYDAATADYYERIMKGH